MTIELVATLVGFVAGVSVWSYSTFQTKEQHKEFYQHIDRRLGQIEDMLHYLIRKDDNPKF